MTDHEPRYVPAMGRDFLLRLYDPIVRLLMRETTLRGQLLDQAEIGPGHHVLDIGCGTGTMAILVARQRPGSTVVGLDGDPKVLAIARRKAERASVSIRFDESMADRLPYPDGSFDRALSSLVLHHLTHEGKIGALREARRVLKAGGSVHFSDFGPPVGRYAALIARLVGHEDRLQENIKGRLPQLMIDAGFEEVKERGTLNTIAGTIVFLSAIRP